MNTFYFDDWWRDNGHRFNDPAAAKQAASDLLHAALLVTQTFTGSTPRPVWFVSESQEPPLSQQ